MTDTNATQTTATDATEAPTPLALPSAPVAHLGNSSYTAQWNVADKKVSHKDGSESLLYAPGTELANARGWVAVVTVAATDETDAETVAIPLVTDRAIARARQAHADGHSVTFARVADTKEFAPPKAEKVRTKKVVGVSDEQKAVLQATYATADDATKAVLAATFDFLGTDA